MLRSLCQPHPLLPAFSGTLRVSLSNRGTLVSPWQNVNSPACTVVRSGSPWGHFVPCVLQRLLENRLYTEAEKCEFDVSLVSFPGFIMKPGDIHTDWTQVSAVLGVEELKCLFTSLSNTHHP